MNEISIQKATVEHLELLVAIGKETFFETFAESNTEADMAQYLKQNFTEGKITAELSNPDTEFYIAYEGINPAGYLKVNTGNAQTELHDENSLEIERIYVKSAYHGKKVGQLLYEKAVETAVHKNKAFIWLGVWEQNPRAIRFYEKNGFVAFCKHLFKMGNDEQTDIMMKKNL